ncbi:MAG: DUF2252 domain-containing protein [Nocardioidaceae bacterium]|nr:DUF2252 domain-containing protein [Nocardioidaceae bacterium]NUS51716.1 DUF2252 domain-containing protein [Nocardioidaceae bacterium]
MSTSSTAVRTPRAPRTSDDPADRAAAAKALRTAVPLRSHADLDLAAERDPVGLLLGQAESRVPELVPLRHGRMLASPFAFYRGAALPMAADLSRTPTSGLRAQLCGDAHLANFGAFASPERRLVFDLNDFDETLPGPFEWDVKRLVASLEVAARERGFQRKARQKIVLAGAKRYRETMREFAAMPNLEVWYAGIDVEEALRTYRKNLKKGRYESTAALLAKARKRDSTQALGKLTTMVDGQRRIVSDPPLVVPAEDLFTEIESDSLYRELGHLVGRYGDSLPANRRHLLHQFRLVQVARKVVGVGSVGTRAWILLLEADGGREWLFLQAKEAQASVLADYAGASRYDNQGHRVVAGQLMMQAASDIFLGFQRTTGLDGIDRDYYVRQLRDWKLSAPIEEMIPSGMGTYAELCAWTLARAHARTGDRIAIAAYLGGSDKFDKALVEFADAYADTNERDHAALAQAVADGRVQAAPVS